MASSLEHETPATGLRERKKLATRRALHDAALELATEHGIDVTVEEICTAADVSPRTFFNYFSSKDEAIIGEPPAVPPDDLLTEFEQGGPTGDLLSDLHEVILRHLRTSLPTLKEMHLRRQVLDQHPELAARFMGSFMTIERRLALAAARRRGTDPYDVHAQLIGGVASAAMRLSVRRWAHSDEGTQLDDHITEVFAALRDLD